MTSSSRPVVGKYLPPPPPMPVPNQRAAVVKPIRASSTTSVPLLGICRTEESFEQMGKLGEDAMRELGGSEIYAVKKIRMEKEKDGLPITALREIQILKSLQHPNIVALKEIIVGKDPGSLSLVFEFIEHDLAALLDTMKTPFSESEVKCLVQQLLLAVHYLHRNFIIHRDLKLANLLMNNRGQLKLADFGLARIYGEPVKPYTPKVVTLWYRAPELLLGAATYTTSIDLWGVGCIFGELVLKTPLLPGKTEIDQLRKIIKLLGSPNPRIWPSFPTLPGAKDISSINEPYSSLVQCFPTLSQVGLDLLNRLLTYDPDRRISASAALDHPYWTSQPLPTKEEWMPTHSISYRKCSLSFTLPDQNKRTTRGPELDSEQRPAKKLAESDKR